MVTKGLLKFYNKYYNLFVFTSILLFSIILYIIDLTSLDGNKCLKQIKTTGDKIKYTIIILIHNIIIYTLLLGWLFNDIRVLLFLLLCITIILIQWIVLRKCILTDDAEKICKNENSKYFNDIFKMLGLKKYTIFNNLIFYFITFLLLCLYIYKISYKNGSLNGLFSING